MKRIIVMLGALLIACTAERPVFDDIVITIQDFAEYGDEYGRAGRVILSVENPTPVPVCTAAISLSLVTDSRSYYTTIHDDRGIPPGMEIFIIVEFVYISPQERASMSGIAVTGCYFA